jgi:hypothetical protein
MSGRPPRLPRYYSFSTCIAIFWSKGAQCSIIFAGLGNGGTLDNTFEWYLRYWVCCVQAGVEGSIEIPIYIPETEWSVVNLLKQASNFGLGGWWLGGSHMIPNQQFLREVQTKIPKDAKVIVACQKGLRCVAHKPYTVLITFCCCHMQKWSFFR